MPAGPFLYADELLATLRARHAAAGYQELVGYVEACESGSVFEGLLGDELDAYVRGRGAGGGGGGGGSRCRGPQPAAPGRRRLCWRLCSSGLGPGRRLPPVERRGRPGQGPLAPPAPSRPPPAARRR
jgi:hypothetical protein